MENGNKNRKIKAFYPTIMRWDKIAGRHVWLMQMTPLAHLLLRMLLSLGFLLCSRKHLWIHPASQCIEMHERELLSSTAVVCSVLAIPQVDGLQGGISQKHLILTQPSLQKPREISAEALGSPSRSCWAPWGLSHVLWSWCLMLVERFCEEQIAGEDF